MKNFSLKFIASVLLTGLIVSGIVYAKTIDTLSNQSIASNDIMSASWFQQVNDKLLNSSTTTLKQNSCQWVSAPNAYVTLYGGVKEAMCPVGQYMAGTRFFEISDKVDDEHVDAYCCTP